MTEKMKKDGYTWEDLDKSYWEGFDNAKNKMEKRIEELEQLNSNQAESLRATMLEEEKKNKRIEELEKELAISEHDREHNDYELTEVYKKVSELEQQIEKMKCCINDLVHLGDFNENTDEEYTNYLVHEALKNAEQFLKEIEK